MTEDLSPRIHPANATFNIIGLALWIIWLFSGMTLCPLVRKMAYTQHITLPLLTRMMMFLMNPYLLFAEALVIAGVFLYLQRTRCLRHMIFYAASAAIFLFLAFILVFAKFGSLSGQALPPV